MTRSHALRAAVIPCALAALLLPASAQSQSWKDRVKAAAAQGAAEAATRKSEEAARKGTEKTIDAALGAAGEKAGALVGTKGAKDAATAPASGADAIVVVGKDEAATTKSAADAWANYDFVPGTRPLYVDDFTSDAVGDFPRRMKWKNGNFEVVEFEGGRWMRATTFGEFAVQLPETLPQRFTLELEMIAPSGWAQSIYFGPESRGNHQPRVSLAPDRGGVYIDGVLTAGSPKQSYAKRPFALRVMADGQHVKVFMGETRVANVPQIDLGRERTIRFNVSASAEYPVLISRVRVMAGGRALYDALSEGGRVATQGIRFATNSDALLPESTPTLKEIAAMLASHGDLALLIEGHTDNVGAAAGNQALSDKRAAAVKTALVDSYNADAARLTTQGFGASKPTLPNSSEEGRAANRRVELVKR